MKNVIDRMGKSEDTSLHIILDLSLQTGFLSVQENMAVNNSSTL